MMKRVASYLLAIIVATQAHAFGLSATAIENVDWQLPFANAVRWSTLGVHDDSGATDNLAALNALPGGVPIIGDCPHGGYIQMSANWVWPSNLLVWQQPGCVIESTNTDINLQVVAAPLTTAATAPVTGVKYYGLQIDCLTPTRFARAVRWWLNHSDIRHSTITRCGGQAGRFGDSYFAFNHWDTYPNNQAGNPGIRELGTDNVPLSPGMPKQLWFRYSYVRSGDIGLQACQPATIPGAWTSNVSTDGVLFQNTFVHASTMLIANLQDDTNQIGPYSCHDMMWDNIVGESTYLGFVVPGIAGLSSNDGVYIYGVAQNKIKGGNHASFGIGSVGIGGHKQYKGKVLSNVVVNRAIITSGVNKSSDTSGLDVEGCMTGSILVQNSSFDAVSTSTTPDPAIDVTGCSVTLLNNIAKASPLADAIRIGAAEQASGIVLSGNVVTGVADGFIGYNLLNTNGVTVSGGSVTPAAQSIYSTGIALASEPQGTHGANIHGVNLSAMTIYLRCAPGQGNVVTGNTPSNATCPP